ncbi:hypothetical protein DFH09DRAFT_1070125 [Mycena vulgaris]|nr:hypothetical protein DFH09DRAFT_1070125 [Mycena vulgaris]
MTSRAPCSPNNNTNTTANANTGTVSPTTSYMNGPFAHATPLRDTGAVLCGGPGITQTPKSIRELIYKGGYSKVDKQHIPLSSNTVIGEVLGKYTILSVVSHQNQDISNQSSAQWRRGRKRKEWERTLGRTGMVVGGRLVARGFMVCLCGFVGATQLYAEAVEAGGYDRRKSSMGGLETEERDVASLTFLNCMVLYPVVLLGADPQLNQIIEHKSIVPDYVNDAKTLHIARRVFLEENLKLIAALEKLGHI